MDNLRYDCSKLPCDDDTAAAERIRYNTSSPLDIAAQSLPQWPQLLVTHIETDKVVEYTPRSSVRFAVSFCI